MEEKAQQLGGPAVLLAENLGSVSRVLMASVSNPNHGRPNTLSCPPQAPHNYGAVIKAGKTLIKSQRKNNKDRKTETQSNPNMMVLSLQSRYCGSSRSSWARVSLRLV